MLHDLELVAGAAVVAEKVIDLEAVLVLAAVPLLSLLVLHWRLLLCVCNGAGTAACFREAEEEKVGDLGGQRGRRRRRLLQREGGGGAGCPGPEVGAGVGAGSVGGERSWAKRTDGGVTALTEADGELQSTSRWDQLRMALG